MKVMVLFLLFLVVPSMVFATSWAYAFVVWDGYEYKMTEEYTAEAGERIGEVTSHSDMEQYGGNFSNAYEKGTAYFQIPGTPVEDRMAVEDGDNYRIAERVGAYTHGAPFTVTGSGLAKGILIAFLIFGMSLAALMVLAFYYMRKG